LRIANIFRCVAVFENILGCADGLLNDVVNVRQPFHGLIKHEQRDDKARELSWRKRRALNLRARIAQQTHNCHGTEEFNQRRSNRLLQHVAQIAFQ